MDIEELVKELHGIGCVKFGQFTLKSGLKSPIYFDLRLLVSYPHLLKLSAKVFADKLKELAVDYDIICGVPYGAISLATAISMDTGKSMIFKRKEIKSHGTSKMIEGHYRVNQDKCLIVDDVITSGISIMETVKDLRDNGVLVNDAIVLLDREQGGMENLTSHNIKLHSILKTSDVLEILFRNKCIDQITFDTTKEFLNQNKNVPLKNDKTIKQELDFETRAGLCKNEVGKKLFEIMAVKQTNLCFSADFNTFDQLIQAAESLGPHICLLKTHIDIIDDFNLDKMQQLVDLSLKHNFLIFEDRKFADIGNTVKSQYSKGAFKICQWAHLVNAHSISGAGCVNGLRDALDDVKSRACLLIGELSSKGNLIDESYVKKTVQLAEDKSDFVIGFICQKRLSSNPAFLYITPGVQFNEGTQLKGDNLGQQYKTPESAILEDKCDLIVVGRGIMNSENQKEMAIRYQKAAFDAYLKRLNLEN